MIQFCPKNFLDALWSAYTWMRHDLPDFRLHFVCDGLPPATARHYTQHLFPGSSLEQAGSYINQLPVLSNDLTTYFGTHVFARKTAVIQDLQTRHDVLFSDPDVLVFAKPQQVIDGINNETPLYSRNHNSDHYDPWIADRFTDLGCSLDPDFNSGILYLPRNTIPSDLLPKVFEGWSDAPPHRHAGQSYFSGALMMARALPLDPDQYVARSESKWFWEKEPNYRNLVARHYVGPVRHHLYLAGMPRILPAIL